VGIDISNRFTLYPRDDEGRHWFYGDPGTFKFGDLSNGTSPFCPQCWEMVVLQAMIWAQLLMTSQLPVLGRHTAKSVFPPPL
jgi:hypothetical protein